MVLDFEGVRRNKPNINMNEIPLPTILGGSRENRRQSELPREMCSRADRQPC